MYREGGTWNVGDRRSCHPTSPSLGAREGGHQGAWLPQEGGSTKGTCASGSVGWGLVSGVAQLPWPVRSQGAGKGVGRVVTASSLGW